MKGSNLVSSRFLHKTITPCLILIFIFLSACQPSEITSTFTPTSNSEATSTPTEKTIIKEPTPTEVVTPTPQTPDHLQVDTEDLDGISIHFLHPWAGETASELEEVARQFSLTNPWGIWVDAQAAGSELQLVERLQTHVADGDQPGLIAVHPYLLEPLGDVYTTVPVTDYYHHPEWGMAAEVQADIPARLLEQFTSEGEMIALPVAPRATVIFYNQTWAEELGFFLYPEDEKGFQEQSCDATFANLDDVNIDNDGTGGWLVNNSPEVLASWYHAFGGGLPEDGRPVFDNEISRDAFGYLKGTYDEGCIWIGRLAEPYEYFANRYALMYAGTLDDIPHQAGWMAVTENEDEWTAIGFPGPDGHVLLVDGPGLMISEDTAEKQMAAWLFAMHLLEPDVQARLVQQLFTLPVRYSALDELADFAEEYPQWAETAGKMDEIDVLPISQDWGLAQWVLQDAFERILQGDADQIPDSLEALDRLLDEVMGEEK